MSSILGISHQKVLAWLVGLKGAENSWEQNLQVASESVAACAVSDFAKGR